MPWAQSTRAWGKVYWGVRTHACTHTMLSLFCQMPPKIASGEGRICVWSFINPLEGQSRGAPASLHLRTPFYTHCTALAWLPVPNLVFPQRWLMHQAEQEMPWVGREQLPDKCHLQSAQACHWCVNYSINQHIALGGCQHLITSETLRVNGVCDLSSTRACVHIYVADRSHFMLALKFLLTLNYLNIRTEKVVWITCVCDRERERGSVFFFLLRHFSQEYHFSEPFTHWKKELCSE